MVLRDSAGSRIAFAYGAVTLCGWPFHATSASEPICNSLRAVQCTAGRPYNTPTETAATYHAAGVWAPPLSLATTNGMFVYSSRYLDVSVPSVSSNDLCIQSNVPGHYPGWVSPFGYLRVITLARSSPKHFVACHVLHRLLAPRHPPHALSSLT